MNMQKNFEMTTCPSLDGVPFDDSTLYRPYKISPIRRPSFGYRQHANMWEYRYGGLTALAEVVFDKILRDIENAILNAIIKTPNPLDIEPNLDLGPISNKLKKRQYAYVNEIVYDFRHAFYYANITSTCYNKQTFRNYMKMIQTKFEVLICSNFPNINFSHVNVQSTITFGHLVPNVRIKHKIIRGDGRC